MSPRQTVGAGAALVLAAVAAAPALPALHLVFGAVCHQEPARCFAWHGVLLPVCARCLGIYGGALAAAIRPVHALRPALWVLLVVNGLEFLLDFGSLGIRFGLALALCWLFVSRLIALASLREGGRNLQYSA